MNIRAICLFMSAFGMPLLFGGRVAAFDAAPAAGIDIAKWKWIRTLIVHEGTSVARYAISAQDLSVLKVGAGDLRIVDSEGLQVPYLLRSCPDRDTGKLAIRQIESDREGWSRYELVVCPTAPGDGLIPLEGLTLKMDVTYFNRRARLLSMDAEEKPFDMGHSRYKSGPPVLFDGKISGRQPASTVYMDLNGREVKILHLEVDNGDSAPLIFTEGLVQVVRPVVYFPVQTGGGEYRLLLGNRTASEPRYDLDFDGATGVPAGFIDVAYRGLFPNPSFRPSFQSYFVGVSRTFFLWFVITFVMAVLVILTIKYLPREGKK